MSNRYPGYCIDCGSNVKAGHGELIKQHGKFVVSCGKTSKAVPTHPPKPVPVAPEGVRLTGSHIASSNVALMVSFSVEGIGKAESLPPFAYGEVRKYTRWSDEPLVAPLKPEDSGKSLRQLYPDKAAAHDATCEATEALYAKLKADGQVAHDNANSFHFPLSQAEQRLLTEIVANAKSAMLQAIMDGSAEIRVGEVGCDYPHDQILEITVAGQKQEYALVQSFLGDFSLKVDGDKECKDLAAAIRERQGAQAAHALKVQAHKARRTQGYHVVILRRCWECGRTQIIGELDDNMREIRMSREVYAECEREQNAAHARSLATVPEGTILSSVGFDPSPESKFEFRVVENDWYCGC